MSHTFVLLLVALPDFQLSNMWYYCYVLDFVCSAEWQKFIK